MAGVTFLLVEIGPQAGTRQKIVPGTTIGREHCDVLLADQEASRRHAAIRAVKEGVAVEDLDSRNGTFVNGERIEAMRPLANGDTIQIGTTRWRFHASAEVESASDRAPRASRADRGPGEPPTESADPAPPQPLSRPDGSRGDVPAPEIMPSAVRRIPPPEAVAAPAFSSGPQRRVRGSAARRGGALLASYVVVASTAVAVIAYFAAR